MIEKELLEAYNEDIPNDFMAILVSAMNGDVTWKIQTEEQLSKLVESLEIVANDFIYYYYDYEDNWSLQDISEEDLEYTPENIINNITRNSCISITDFWQVLCEKIDNGFNITFSILDEEKLKQALKSYFVRYEENILHSDYGNPLHRDDYDKLLYNLMTEYDYNLFQFHITDIKYIKPICYNMLVQNSIVLYETMIELNQDSQVINFDCTVDGRYFVEEYKEQKICSSANKEKQNKQQKGSSSRRFHHTYHMKPQQWKIFMCLLNRVKVLNKLNGEENISKEHFINNGIFESDSGQQDTAISRFNTDYNKIIGNSKKEFERILWPKISDTRYYQFNISKIINLYNNIKANKNLLEEFCKHQHFLSQIVD